MRKPFLTWMMLLVILTAFVNMPVTEADSKFADLDNNWAKDEIAEIVRLGIMSGVSDSLFQPERKVTRGEFMAVTARTFRLNGQSEAAYSDVAADAWYAPYISALKSCGVIDEHLVREDGRISPEDDITRQEAAALLWNAFYHAYKNEYSYEMLSFDDADTILKWAAAYVGKVCAAGIMSAANNNSFLPCDTITADQTAVIAYRLVHTEEAYTAKVTPETAGLIESEITEAYARGARKVVVPPGTYYLPEGTSGPVFRTHILLSNMENFTLEGYGVTLVFTCKDVGGIYLLYCRNVKVKGFTTDYKEMIVSQGEITGIADDKSYFELKIDKGYTNDLDNSFWDAVRTGYVFLPDTLKRAEGYSNVAFSVKRPDNSDDDHLWLCYPTNVGMITQLKPGFLLGFRQNGAGMGMNTRVLYSSGTVFEDYTIYTGQMGYLEEASSADRNYVRTHLKNVKVTYGPKPEGAVRQRLMSTVADGLHFSRLQHGPLIEDCVVEGNGDDGVAVHGLFQMVMEEYDNNYPGLLQDYDKGKAFIIAGMWGNEDSVKGDRYAVYDSNGNKKGETRLASASIALDSGDSTRKNSYSPRISNTLGQMTLGSYSIYCFEDDLGIKPADILENLDQMGDGYIIRNTSVIRNAARGMLITSNNGLVEGCALDGSPNGGIVVLPEIGWAQSGYTANMTIRNCTFRNTGYGYEAGLGIPFNAAAINVTADVEGRNHKNIVIDNNRFENNWGNDIYLSNTSGAAIKNNVFGKRSEAAEGLKKDECIRVENSDNVTVYGCNSAPEGRTIYAASGAEKIAGLTPAIIYPMTVTDNQNGLWKYQYSLINTNVYEDYNLCLPVMEGYTPSFSWWRDRRYDSQYGGIISQSQIQTGSLADVVYTFTAPKDGIIEVTINDGVRVNPNSTQSDGARFKIMKNDDNLWPKVGWGNVYYGDIGLVPENTSTTVKKGDQIHFRINCMGNTYFDNIIVSPMVRYKEIIAVATSKECSEPDNYTNININDIKK